MKKEDKLTFSRIFGNVTIENFDKVFSSDSACRKVLSEIKWENGFVCRHCGWENSCAGSSEYSRRCTRCKRTESATANTPFHSCKIQLVDAFKIAFMVCCNPDTPASKISEIMSIRHMTCLNFKKKILECKQKQENQQ